MGPNVIDPKGDSENGGTNTDSKKSKVKCKTMNYSEARHAENKLNVGSSGKFTNTDQKGPKNSAQCKHTSPLSCVDDETVEKKQKSIYETRNLSKTENRTIRTQNNNCLNSKIEQDTTNNRQEEPKPKNTIGTGPQSQRITSENVQKVHLKIIVMVKNHLNQKNTVNVQIVVYRHVKLSKKQMRLEGMYQYQNIVL